MYFQKKKKKDQILLRNRFEKINENFKLLSKAV
jgi:hypothetical protein